MKHAYSGKIAQLETPYTINLNLKRYDGSPYMPICQTIPMANLSHLICQKYSDGKLIFANATKNIYS